MSAAATELQCWRCGTALPPDSLPLRRAETCVACNADLHVCKLCAFYDPGVADACRETIALAVSNKERANYCDYFKPTAGAWRGDGAGTANRAALDALFGGAPASAPSPADSELDRLFGLDRGGRD